jgi:hypothetical protein
MEKAPSQDGAFFRPCFSFLFSPSRLSSVHPLSCREAVLQLYILTWIIPLHPVH